MMGNAGRYPSLLAAMLIALGATLAGACGGEGGGGGQQRELPCDEVDHENDEDLSAWEACFDCWDAWESICYRQVCRSKIEDAIACLERKGCVSNSGWLDEDCVIAHCARQMSAAEDCGDQCLEKRCGAFVIPPL